MVAKIILAVAAVCFVSVLSGSTDAWARGGKRGHGGGMQSAWMGGSSYGGGGGRDGYGGYVGDVCINSQFWQGVWYQVTRSSPSRASATYQQNPQAVDK